VGAAAALEAVIAGDARRAAAEARRAVEADPADPVSRAALALALLALRRPRAALREVDAAVAAAPAAPWALRLRSLALRDAGKPREAVRAAAQAARLAPEVAGAHVSHALALSFAGEEAAARAALSRARALSPEDGEILRLLGEATIRADPAAAEGLLRESLRLAPTAAATRVALGRALEAQGRAEDASAAYEAAAVRDPAFAREREARRRGVMGLVQAAAATFLLVVAIGIAQVVLAKRWPDRVALLTAAAWLSSLAVPGVLLAWAALHLRAARGEGPPDPDAGALARELAATAGRVAPGAAGP
jgi:tetratricopeptide (TPR) repeat protein